MTYDEQSIVNFAVLWWQKFLCVFRDTWRQHRDFQADSEAFYSNSKAEREVHPPSAHVCPSSLEK